MTPDPFTMPGSPTTHVDNRPLTIADLDAMPAGAHIVDRDGDEWVRQADGGWGYVISRFGPGPLISRFGPLRAIGPDLATVAEDAPKFLGNITINGVPTPVVSGVDQRYHQRETNETAALMATIRGLQQSLAHERSARKKANERADLAQAAATAAGRSAEAWERRALSLYRGAQAAVVEAHDWTKR